MMKIKWSTHKHRIISSFGFLSLWGYYMFICQNPNTTWADIQLATWSLAVLFSFMFQK